MNKATKNPNLMILAALLMFSITLASVGTASPAEIEIAVDPPEVKDLEPDTTFTVNITVTNIAINDYKGLYGWDVELKFDSNILNVVEVTEGPFLKTVLNETTWTAGLMLPVIDNDAGMMIIGNTFILPIPPEGATGNGTLATIKFKVVSRGRTSLRFEYNKLYTWIPPDIKYDLEHTAVDGSFDNGAGIEFSIELIIAIITVVIVCCAVVLLYVRRRRA